MITPKPLFAGARVALLAPASPTPQTPLADSGLPQQVQESVDVLKTYGLEPVLYPSCTLAYGYLAGSDAQSAQDVMDAFLDDSIDGIFCIRGGYGIQRMLDLLDFDRIAQHPKWFAGYSDVTALHVALNQRCGFITYHTPMPSTEIRKGLDDYTNEYLKKAMFGGLQGILPSAAAVTSLANGSASGILCGGNLSLVSSSLGTPYEIDTKGKILFLEDIDEAPYRIDGMLNHMRLAGKFEDCAGIIMGFYTNCVPKKPGDGLTLEQVFNDLLPKDKPVLLNYTCGHDLPTMSLPLGATATLIVRSSDYELRID